MNKIFISYRRSDNPDGVKLVYGGLKKLLPGWEIFYDHKSLDLGTQFPDELKQAVTDADFVLVVMGREWLNELRERKKAGETDYVLEEVRTAFETDSTVIPLAVGSHGKSKSDPEDDGKEEKSKSDFPSYKDLVDFPEIVKLGKLNGKQVRPDPDFDNDVEALVGYLEAVGPGVTVDSVLEGKYKLIDEVGSGGMGGRIPGEAVSARANGSCQADETGQRHSRGYRTL